MKNLTDALVKIKENPKKYIGKPSMNRLNLFMVGYSLSQRDESGKYPDGLPEFEEFVRQKYNIYSSIRCSDIISLFSSSDELAFDKFYELLEEFQQQEHYRRDFHELYETDSK